MLIHHDKKHMSKCCYRTVICTMVEEDYIQKIEIYKNKYIYWTTEKIMNTVTINKLNDAIRGTQKQISTTKFTTESALAYNSKKIVVMDEVIQTILVNEFQTNTPYVQDKIMDLIKKYKNSLTNIKNYFDKSQLEASTHMGTNVQQTSRAGTGHFYNR